MSAFIFRKWGGGGCRLITHPRAPLALCLYLQNLQFEFHWCKKHIVELNTILIILESSKSDMESNSGCGKGCCERGARLSPYVRGNKFENPALGPPRVVQHWTTTRSPREIWISNHINHECHVLLFKIRTMAGQLLYCCPHRAFRFFFIIRLFPSLLRCRDSIVLIYHF